METKTLYKHFEFDYEVDELLKLFDDSKKVISNLWLQVTDDITTDWNVLPFFGKFDFIRSHPGNMALASVLSSTTNPYVNPGNNGLIFFPLKGSLECSFYSYQPPLVDGRPHLPPRNSLREVIKPLKSNVITIDKPTAINGLIPHSYELTGQFKFFVLKIPLDVEWNVLVDHIDKLKE
jgi:hypothetical protein